jgi:hypothetical protein
MSKAIRSYPQSERRSVVSRRLEHKTGGLGYWAAVDAQKHQGQVKKVETVEEQPVETPHPVLIETLDS